MRFQLAAFVTILSSVVASVSAGRVDSVELAQREALYERWLDSQASEMVERSLERRTHPSLTHMISNNLRTILAQHELLVGGTTCQVAGAAHQNGHGEWVIPCRNGHNVVINGASGVWKWERGQWMPMPVFG